MKYRFTITYESEVDVNTGEILSTKIVDRKEAAQKKASTKKQNAAKSDEPKLILEANKFTLTDAAIELMGITTEDKIDIKYESSKGQSIPIIGNEAMFGTKGGNKLSASGTVAYRGAKNTELAVYGTEFTVVKHPTKEGLFILQSDKVIEEKPFKGDDKIQIDDEDIAFDLNDFTEDNNDVTEIDESLFSLI